MTKDDLSEKMSRLRVTQGELAEGLQMKRWQLNAVLGHADVPAEKLAEMDAVVTRIAASRLQRETGAIA